MVFSISKYLKEKALEAMEFMIKEGVDRKELPEEGVFITRYPEKEPQGTIFLETLEKENQKFTICQKVA